MMTETSELFAIRDDVFRVFSLSANFGSERHLFTVKLPFLNY
jgi:hypothetical protein